MPSYFEILNADGSHFIDDSFRNFEIIQRGFFNSGSGGMIYYQGSDDLANLVFVRPLNGDGYFRNYGPPPGGMPAAIGIYPAGTYFSIYNQFNGRDFEYIVARIGGVSDTVDNFGLQVFGESGDEIFHSSRKYLTLVDSWSQNLVTTPSPLIRQLPTPSYGKNLFVCINFMPVTRVTWTPVEQSQDTFTEAWAVNLNGTQLSITSFLAIDGELGYYLSWEAPSNAAQVFLIAEA